MATQRYISTSFWDDEWIQTLDPSEKLLYLYLMTNPLTTIAGAYKLSIRRICFDTGFNSDTVTHILAKFQNAKKAYHFKEYLILPSWPKHQKWEIKQTIKKGIDFELAKIPDDVKSYMVSIGYLYPIEGYEYRPSYSEFDSDSDINSKFDIDSDSCASLGNDSSNPKKAGCDKIEKAKAAWNARAPAIGPPCRMLAITFHHEDLENCLRTFAAYSEEEIAEAIETYAAIRASPEHDIPAQYRSFIGFIRGGVEKFIAAAEPWTAYKKKAPQYETAGAREERERAEALARLHGGRK